MAKFCSSCGAQAADNEKFCASCGAAFPDVAGAVSPEPVMQTAVQSEAVPAQDYSSSTAAQTDFSQPAVDQNAGYYQNPYNSAVFNDGGVSAAPKKKLNPIPLIIGAVVLVAIIVVCVVVANITKYQKIDAKELFDVDFGGPDGYGVCYAQLDVDPDFAYSEYNLDIDDYSITKLGESSDDIKYSKYFSSKSSTLTDTYNKASDRSEAKDMRDALLKANKKTGQFKITCKLSKESGLKNGDKVTVTVKYDEEYLKENKIKLTNTTFEVEVKGLDEAETVEPFKDLEPTYEGNDGGGSADFSDYSNVYDFISFSINSDSSRYYLSNGDTVTIDAYISVYNYEYLDSEDKSQGFWFTYDDKLYVWPYEDTEVSQDFTVSGLTELTAIDPFDEIEISYSGATPFVRLDANFKDGSVLKGNATVGIDEEYGTRYKIGDTFTVKVYAYSSLANDGYKLEGTPDSDGYITKVYTVDETAPSYVDETNAYAADQALESEFTDKETYIKQNVAGSKYFSTITFDAKAKSVSSIDLVSRYSVYNEIENYDNIGWGSYVNSIVRLYKITVKTEDGKDAFYAVMTLKNVIDDNGEFTSDSIDVDYYAEKSEALEAVEGLDGYIVNEVSEKSASSSDSKTDTAADSTVDTASSTADSSAADSSSTSSSTTSSSTSSSSTSSSDGKPADSSAADSSSELVP